MVLEVLADPGQVVHDVDAERLESAALPTPETCNSWGELIAPPQRTTVAGADLRGGPAAVLVLHADGPLALEEDPGTNARVTTSRLGRFITGWR